jgi:hypothetical protein
MKQIINLTNSEASLVNGGTVLCNCLGGAINGDFIAESYASCSNWCCEFSPYYSVDGEIDQCINVWDNAEYPSIKIVNGWGKFVQSQRS